VSELAPSYPGWGARLRRVATIMLVFVVVGPPIGEMAFILSTTLIDIRTNGDLAGIPWAVFFALIYAAVPVSYLIGIGPAAVVGLFVGIRQAFFGAIGWPFVLAIGLGAGMMLKVVAGQPLLPASGEDTTHFAELAVIAATCLSSTFVCWAIVRNWHFDSLKVRLVPA
jgi:hypothetical protein